MAHLERALDQAGLRARARAADRLHARPRRPLRPGAADRRARRLRGLDAPEPRPPHGGGRPGGGARAPRRGRPPERRARPSPLQRWVERRRSQGTGQAGTLRIDRELTEGDTVDTDLGDLAGRSRRPATRRRTSACYQPERRLLISGDHLLGRVSLYFDVGYTPDPVGEFLRLARQGRRARRAARAGRPRPPVHRRRAAHVDGQPRARRRAARRRPRRARRRPAHRLRDRPARSTASASARRRRRWLLTKTLAWLTHLERRGLGASCRRRRRSAGRSPPRLPACASTSGSRRGASPRSRSSSSRRRPTRASATSAARWRSSRGWSRPSCRSPTAPAARTDQKRKTIDIVVRASRPSTASRRWPTSPASAPPSTSCARRSTVMRDAGIENVLALRGDPPPGETEWTATEGGLDYSRELIELIRDDYDFAIGAACFPEVHIHADSAESDLRYLQGEGRRRRALPDHAAVLRQRALLRVRRPRARDRASTSRSSRGSCRSPTTTRSSASRACAAPTIPDRPAARARAARRPARRGARLRRRLRDPAVRRPAGQGRARASTSTRSTARTATRAILSALRVMAPWRDAVPA